MRFADDCKDTKDLVYNNQGISFKLDTEKEGPKRDPLALKIEEEIINFNQNGDRCAGDSPVLKGGCNCTFIQGSMEEELKNRRGGSLCLSLRGWILRQSRLKIQ